MKNFISVVIPTFCRTTIMLNNAVQSVKKQIIPVDEIIIVDDNNDNSLSENILRYCQENELTYIASKNVGAATARNIGISIANGDYIAFLDDDDIWLPNKLLIQMPLFLNYNTGLVYSRGYTIKSNVQGNVLKTPYATDHYYKTEVHYEDLLEKNYIGTTSQIIVKKSILVQLSGFDESLPSRQDYDLCLRIAQYYRCLGANEYLFLHNIHSENQITANAIINMQGYILLYKKYKTDIQQVKDASRKWCYRIMHHAFASKSYAIFIKYFFMVILYNPLKFMETIKKCFKK